MGEGLRYQVIITKQPEKALRKLPKNVVVRLAQAIDVLSESPRPSNCKKLVGYENLYRVRVGNWRISYAIEDDRLIVLVLEVAARGSAYQKL